MFSLLDSGGEPITRAYAERRVLNERLVEIVQNKGTSETRPAFSPDDAFAGFELLDLPAERASDPAGGYLRPALGRGLEVEAQIGSNPFRFGFVGSTDSHAGVSSTEEDNFAGALGRSDDMRDPRALLETVNPIAGAPATVFSAGGLTGVWADENTRESLFAALKRREVFATSGTRLRLRLFAGFGFPSRLIERPDWVDVAYTQGVPMGGALLGATRPDGAHLELLVHAAKAPEGARLDRLQIVKIWLEDGRAREQVVDLAIAGGAVALASAWQDADFDPAVPAIYYARALEVPTPRWSTHLAQRNTLEVPTNVPAEIQERAWSSPIFYEP
jgi:hypothetical protein